jgi:hypothetical protein
MKQEENVWERLRENVNTVREVLQSNLKLREKITEQATDIENLKIENDVLMNENTELRNKLEISKSIGNCKDTLQENSTINDRSLVADKIYNLQRENGTLKARIIILEKQNIEFQKQTKNIDFEGKDQIEPVRPVTTHKFNEKFNVSARTPIFKPKEDVVKHLRRPIDVRTGTAIENYKRGASARKKSELPKKLAEIPPRHDSTVIKTYNKNSLISLNKIPNKYNYYDHNATISEVSPNLDKINIKGQDYYELQSFTYYDNFDSQKKKA